MKKTILGILCFFIIIGVICCIPIYHNVQLNKFANQLDNIDFPENVEIVDRVKICGKLTGNGNSLDYFACVLVQTSEKREALEKLLNESDIVQVENGDKVCRYREVVPVHEALLESRFIEHETVEFKNLEEETNFRGYYALIIYDGGYEPIWDLRGH